MDSAKLIEVSDAFIKLSGPEAINSVMEDSDSLTLTLPDFDVDQLCDHEAELKSIAPFSEVKLTYQIQHGTGTLRINSGKFFVKSIVQQIIQWDSLPRLEENTKELVSQLNAPAIAALSKSISQFCRAIKDLQKQKVNTEISLLVTLNKTAILSEIVDLPKDKELLPILFIYQKNAEKFILNLNLMQLSGKLDIGSQSALCFLIHDLDLFIYEKNLIVAGRGYWHEIPRLKPAGEAGNRLNKTLAFWDRESQIDVKLRGLNPHFFYPGNNIEKSTKFVVILNNLCCRLSIIFLANRIRKKGNNLICEFLGFTRVKIVIPGKQFRDVDLTLYELFKWAYENSSSDKLEIVRQIIAMELSSRQEENYVVMLEKAKDILAISKSNFGLFLRKNVEKYFQTRLQISEMLHRFAREIGEGVSELTSELVSNFYKTLGVIIGLAAVYFLKPDLNIAFIGWTAAAILAYIVLLVAYVLPSIYLKYDARVRGFNNNVGQIGDILTKDELTEIQGDLFSNSVWHFRVYFGVTHLLYILFAVLCVYVFQFIAQL